MTSKLQVYWREKEGTFLPPLEEDLEAVLLAALKRYRQDIAQGKIACVSIGDPLKAGGVSDIDAMMSVVEALRERFGPWLSSSLSHQWRDFWSPHRRTRALVPVEEAVKRAAEMVRRLHHQSDALLKEARAHFLKSDQSLAEANMAEVVEYLVNRQVRLSGCDDRWFQEVCEDVEQYAGLKNADVDADVVDGIAERHFSSWVAPEENAAMRFADEVAALLVKKRFEEEYGER